MEARRCVEFTDVELAAPVEKDAAGPVEKVTAGRSGGEGGPHAGEHGVGRMRGWSTTERWQWWLHDTVGRQQPHAWERAAAHRALETDSRAP
jgi:hypothetical protein